MTTNSSKLTAVQKSVIFGGILAIAGEVGVWAYKHETRKKDSIKKGNNSSLESQTVSHDANKTNSNRKTSEETKKKKFTFKDRMEAVRDEIKWQASYAFKQRDFEEEQRKGERRRRVYEEYIKEQTPKD